MEIFQRCVQNEQAFESLNSKLSSGNPSNEVFKKITKMFLEEFSKS